MQVPFQPTHWLNDCLREAAKSVEAFGPDFDPQVKPSDPRFGDYQANGVLPFAKKTKQNPRVLGEALLTALLDSGHLPEDWATAEIAGPGFHAGLLHSMAGNL